MGGDGGGGSAGAPVQAQKRRLVVLAKTTAVPKLVFEESALHFVYPVKARRYASVW
jgi:hypothetical protein